MPGLATFNDAMDAIQQRRYLEIDCNGMAFHELRQTGPIAPPANASYCDCEGKGRHTFNPQTVHLLYKQVDDGKGGTRQITRDEWTAAHNGPTCKVRHQYFVDVTNRPEAQLDMYHDSKTDAFVRKL